jgi:hypothetical protein
VVDSRHHGRSGKIQYLIKWKGYPDSENQWVSWDDVNAPELLAEFKERNPNALSHIRGTIGDENLTSLGFPPATVRSSLTPALHSFIRSTLSNMSNASNTSAYEGPLTRVNTPSSVSESDSDKENVAPIPIPSRTATPFSGESAIRTALRIETPQNAHEYDAIFRVLQAMRADDKETGHPRALADITGRAIVLEEHTGRDGGVYSTTSVPTAEAHIRPPPRTETPPPLRFHCNRGRDYVPFLITAEDGRRWPVQWVQLTLADDPYMVGFRANDDHLYGGPIHAAPDFDISEKPMYSQEDAIVFKPGFEGAARIDVVLNCIHDMALKAEVHRYRAMCHTMGTLHLEIKKLEQRLFEAGLKQKASLRRLEMANTMGRLEDEIQEYTDREVRRDVAAFVARGRST